MIAQSLRLPQARREFTEASAPSRLGPVSQLEALFGLRAELLHFLLHLVVSSSSSQDNSPDIHSPPALSPQLLLYASSSRPANFIYLLFPLNLLLRSRRILCTGTCFSCSFPAMALNLEKALQNVRTPSTAEWLDVWQLLILPSMAHTTIIRFVRMSELPRCCVEIRSSIQSATSATSMDVYLVRPC